MRHIIESLRPEDHRINWKWVATVFAVYVVAVVAAAGMLANHQPTRLAGEAAKQRSVADAPLHIGSLARSD